ncbi:MAG TPA: aminotransferase class I/II-fold pyridoxal phosphate-dependent enzyme [Candidatus Limnocylindria bacterium]|nr:aminotransferase class I/II-fold pyridoxal phosphate-dependent enzyme [Candidatus Limnocylindria bacterium]
MSDRLPRPRADLETVQAYRTQQLVADVRVNANEWPEPNPAGRYLEPRELDDILLNRYPSAAATADLRATLAARHGIAPEQLIFGNGSNELLLNVFLVFGGHGRATLLFQPTYSMHARLTQIAGGTVVEAQIGLPYDVTMDAALAAMARTKPHIVVFTTPNNPTGNLVDEAVILAVAERYPETVVLVDEAYSDFSGNTVVPRIAAHPNIIVTKTFSKVHAAAGLRLGLLIVDPRVGEIFRAAQLPYNVSPLTTVVGAKIAKREDDVRRRIAECATERARVYDALRRAPGVEAFPSVTNFLLFRLAGDSRGPAEVHAKFLEHSVLIRDISMWPGCARCLRVSIGTRPENDRVIAAIESVFAKAPARA